jgi:hypothetical protein
MKRWAGDKNVVFFGLTLVMFNYSGIGYSVLNIPSRSTNVVARGDFSRVLAI